jgi:hypothetical protein
VLDLHDPVDPVFASVETGSRIATRVRVTVPGAFQGKRGMVVRIHHDGMVIVRLDRAGVDLGFGVSELEREGRNAR